MGAYTWVFVLCAVTLVWAGIGILEALYIIVTRNRRESPAEPGTSRRKPRPRHPVHSWRALRRS